MVTYRCDRCGIETTPDKLYEVEVVFTPRHLEGAMDTDNQDVKTLGDLCADCTDVVEPQLKALVKPPSASAVDPSVSADGAADSGTPTTREKSLKETP